MDPRALAAAAAIYLAATTGLLDTWSPGLGDRLPDIPVAAAGSLTAPSGFSGGQTTGPYATEFNQAGARHGVDPALLSAIAHCESGYDPSARSPAGAQGLMQFMPATARAYGVDPWDPASAIDGAARYLADSQDRGWDRASVIASYNAGPGAVARHGGVPPYRETRNYVACVTGRI